jgi:hypothetical protein
MELGVGVVQHVRHYQEGNDRGARGESGDASSKAAFSSDLFTSLAVGLF